MKFEYVKYLKYPTCESLRTKECDMYANIFYIMIE